MGCRGGESVERKAYYVIGPQESAVPDLGNTLVPHGDAGSFVDQA